MVYSISDPIDGIGYIKLTVGIQSVEIQFKYLMKKKSIYFEILNMFTNHNEKLHILEAMKIYDHDFEGLSLHHQYGPPPYCQRLPLTHPLK